VVLTGSTARARAGSSQDPPSMDSAEVGRWHQALRKGVADAAAERVDHVFFGMTVGRVVDPLASPALASVSLKGVPQPRAPWVEQRERSTTMAAAGRRRVSIRSSRVFFVPCTVLLLELRDAPFKPDEISDGHHVGQHGPQRRQPDRLRPGFLGKFGDLVGCPGSPMGHSADGLVEVAAAIRLNLGSDLRFAGPALSRPLGHAVGACPISTRFCRRQRGGELALEARSFFFRHGTHHRV
jgi:hypothetical protein